VSTKSAASPLIVTVNKRLAAELRERHDTEQRQAGRRVWASADILPWDAWINRLYESLIDAGHADLDLLTPQQERLLWQQVIEHDPRGSLLLHTTAAARMAQTGHALCTDWHLDDQAIAGHGNDETRTFLAWRQRFDDQLHADRQITRAQLLPRIADAFRAHELQLPKQLQLAGFDSLSPAQKQLLDALAETGCEVAELTAAGGAAASRRVVATDPRQEMRLAAEWAAAQVATSPAQRVAVVVPQLAQIKADIVRVFGQVLAPEAYLRDGDTDGRFNVSLGEPLAEQPIIDAALLLLGSLRGEHPLTRIGKLLRSPFIGGHHREWARRAQLDAMLREDGLPRITLHRLRTRIARLTPDATGYCPALLANLEDATAVLDDLPRRDSPTAWVGHLQRLLSAFGWPGETTLNSIEFQQHDRFKRLLSDFAALTKVVPRMTLADAVRQLRTLAEDAVFQAESSPAPIQILGPLEASGIRFDAIWLLGMHDQAWPPSPQPHPLLPARLQRERDMPHASAERELAFATALTTQLRQNCKQIVASHAQADGDLALRPSPLIADWTADDETMELADLALVAACGSAGLTETMPAPTATPPRTTPRGGSGLLAAQAACPFRATARFRLDAQPLAEPTTAADAALQGGLVHELLQRLWHKLQDSSHLDTLDRHQAEALALQLAQETLDDIGRHRPDLYTARYRRIEAHRLSRLAADWLDAERGRERAFRVVALEQSRSVRLGKLELITRADRIDELDDGSRVIIDYKTGRKVATDGWFDSRLNEPQLPLYCIADDHTVSAALLARVRNDDTGCRFIGLSRDPDIAVGVTVADGESGPTWEHTLDHWRRSLNLLGDEITAGRADPTPSVDACRYCPLDALCRVGETHAESSDD
jgi:probable DNA repair protein